MPHASRLLVTVSTAALVRLAASAIAPVPCSALSSPGSLRLVTFDVFAALMQTMDSLTRAVAVALPAAIAPANVVNDWVNCYGGFAGSSFDPTLQTPQPFPWVMRRCLWVALNNSGLGLADGPGTPPFEALVVAWSSLTPYPGTAEALRLLSGAGLLLGALSNGDRSCLANATAVFLPGVQFTHVFPSDFPVGAFKPAAEMYAQAAYAAAEMGWGPDSVLHVAGSPTDAQRARDYGLLSVLLTHGQAPNPAPATQPCAVLADISALPSFLNATAYPPPTPTGSNSPAASASGAGSASGSPSGATPTSSSAATSTGSTTSSQQGTASATRTQAPAVAGTTDSGGPFPPGDTTALVIGVVAGSIILTLAVQRVLRRSRDGARATTSSGGRKRGVVTGWELGSHRTSAVAVTVRAASEQASSGWAAPPVVAPPASALLARVLSRSRTLR